MTPAPATGISLGKPRESRSAPGINTYLWVIDENGIPYVLDEELVELNGRRPKHTNLTSGGVAFVGGEMWFEAADKMWISGSSGRYHPLSAEQLEDSVKVFESHDYSVWSLGWDFVNDRANRFLGE